MKPSLYSYTGTDGAANTTLNNGTAFRCYFTKLPIVPDASPNRIARGDAQEPHLAGMKPPGFDIEMTFECLQSNPRDGIKILTAMFSSKDKRDKTLVFKDGDDSDKQWQFTCRNKGVPEARGPKILVCHASLKSAIALTVTTNSETSWDTTTPTNAYTIGVGNLDVFPVLDISVPAASGSGQKYCRFVKVRNYTRQSALQYPINITDNGTGTGTLDTAGIVKVAATNTASTMAGITAGSPATGGTLTNLASTASFPSSGMVIYDNEQIAYTGKTATTFTGITRGFGGSTAASHANPTTVYLSKAAFDGRDVRVKTGDGSGVLSDVPFWFGTGANAWNTAATKIFTNKTFVARAFGTLAANISNVDTSLTITDAEGNIDPTNGVLFFSSGTEVTPYVGYNRSTGVASGLTRAGRDGAAGAHTAGEVVYFIEDVWLYHGSTTAAALTYETDPVYLAQKPPFALTSTNLIWTYNNFASTQANNPYEFTPSPGTGVIFTQDASAVAPIVPATLPAPANPVTDIGVAAIAKSSAPYWQVIAPFGYSSFVLTTVKRLNLPSNRAWLEASDGTISLIAPTTLVNTWQTTGSVTVTPASGFAYWAKLKLWNTGTAAWTRWAAISGAAGTLNISTSTTSADQGAPYVSMGSEQNIDVDVNATIGNSTTGESFQIKFPNLAVGYTLRIDCLAHAITYLKDGSNAYSCLQPYPARENWLRMQQGSNTLTCSQTGLAIVVKEQYRNEGLA